MNNFRSKIYNQNFIYVYFDCNLKNIIKKLIVKFNREIRYETYFSTTKTTDKNIAI